MRLLMAAALVLLSAASAAAQPDLSEIGRGAGAVGLSSSEAPAVRAEGQTREPSPGFLLGAAVRAWTNAAAILAFDLANPGFAGPAHASQTGEVSEFLREECREEAVAFEAVTRRLPPGLDPAAVISAAGGAGDYAARWADRKAGPAAACR